MERQRQPRVVCYQRASLTLLTGNRRSISCRVVRLSRRGMSVVAEEPLPLGAPVSIETRGWLALGEVCGCRLQYSHYDIGLLLEQMLIGLRDLDLIRRKWRHEETRPRVHSFALDVTEQSLAQLGRSL